VNLSQYGENMSNVAISSTTINCNYTTNANSVIYASPTSTANLTLSLQNVPVPGTYYGSYTVSVLLPVSSYKVCVSNTTVNGTTIIPISSGGFTNISINQNATYVLQQFNIIFTGTAVPIIITNLISLF
jgi:hypothetical protein